MSRFFKLIGLFACVLMLGIIVAVGALFVHGSALDRESRDYVEAVIPAITSTWDKRALISRAAPELVKAVDVAQIDTFFARFRQLGPIVSFEVPKGAARIFYSPSGSQESASYESDATFQNGTARFRIQLCKHEGQWMIFGFFLDSMKLLPSHA